MTALAKADLKLLAFDAEDLAVVAAHLQDAVVQVGDLAWRPQDRRFVALVNRFDWAKALSCGREPFERRRAALRVERVLKAQIQGIDLKRPKQVLSLLTVQFTARGAEDPAGELTLLFAGGAAIRLDVECIEAVIEDLGAAWRARRKPEHPEKL
jgi:hypothetical protein